MSPAIPLLLAITLFVGCDSSSFPVNPLRVDADLKRGPYVQLGDTESILVVWQTFPDTEAVVEFGLTESLGTSVSSGEFGKSHSLRLTGLLPNTDYYYRVLDGHRPLSQIVSFHTNHGPGDANFSFLVLGDSGTGSPEMFAVADLINTSNVSFGLHTGDVIYPNGEEKFYDPRFFFPYANFLATNVMYMSLGNHDMLTEDGAPYLNNHHLPANNSIGDERYYSFDYGLAHFVALDTNQPTEPGSAQHMWLQQDLAVTTKPWKFAFFHHPPHTAAFLSEGGERLALAFAPARENLAPVFELFGVDIVFSGHSHSYERMYPILQDQAMNQEQEPEYVNPDGPIYIVTGGGGAPLLGLDASPFQAQALAAHHIVEIYLSDDGLVGRATDTSGVVIDEFRVKK